MTAAATDIFHELTEADLHFALGTTALASVLAAKAAIERFSLPGTLLFFGEPAEKVCGSKPVHTAKGYYDGADAFISYQPHFTNTAIWDTQCGSYCSAVFTFEAIEPERSTPHHARRGIVDPAPRDWLADRRSALI